MSGLIWFLYVIVPAAGMAAAIYQANRMKKEEDKQ